VPQSFSDIQKYVRNRWAISSRVEIGGILDHLSILLEISKASMNRHYPLKFNLEWLKEEYYRNMVMDSWVPLEDEEDMTFMQHMAENIGKIRKETILWEKEFWKK
jgi:hypothetical protein